MVAALPGRPDRAVVGGPLQPPAPQPDPDPPQGRAADREPAPQPQARPGADRRPRRVPASTVHAVLVRHGLNRLAWMDRPTGESIRRYEHDRPGELVHVDIKKLGQIPPGGGWRVHGRSAASTRPAPSGTDIGYCYVHSAVDDHTRLAYSEVLDDEQAPPPSAFWQRARAFFAAHGITVERVLTDNGSCYRVQATGSPSSSPTASHHATPGPTGPRPTARSNGSTAPCSTNGPTSAPTAQKRERRRRTRRAGSTPTTITATTPPSAAPPITRVNNLPGHYS